MNVCVKFHDNPFSTLTKVVVQSTATHYRHPLSLVANMAKNVNLKKKKALNLEIGVF